jgi:hypothetical protein
MAIIRISQKAIEKKIVMFLKQGIAFRKESTNGRTIVHASGRWGSWMSTGGDKKNKFFAKELSFIKGVKDHIIKNETYKNVKNNFKKEGSTL